MNEIVNNIIVGVMTAICVAAGIFAWWKENGPDPKNKEEKQTKPNDEQNADTEEVEDK